MNLRLKPSEKVRIIDDLIFPDNLPIGTTGYMLKKDSDYVYFAFYPEGNRFDLKLEVGTDFDSYIERTE